MKQKKIPVRMCVACRTGRPKRELIRIVNDKENGVMVDKTGKAQGRGAYICPTLECLEKAWKIKAISRALDCDITEEAFLELKKVILRREIDK